MKLFAVYIGGALPAANIELHDMRFVVADSIEHTFDELRRQWWGAPDSLHIDCWAEIDHADGYDVVLRSEPFKGEEKLFFVYMGGYDHMDFTEKHKSLFIVAKSVAEAKSRALKSIRGWQAPHRDNLYEAEKVFALQNSVDGHQLYLHLSPGQAERDFRFTCEYRPIRQVVKSVKGRQSFEEI